MKKNPNRKAFTSSKSDRGILVKILDKTVSLSFWGDNNPKNIVLSEEEALGLCAYIIESVSKQREEKGSDSKKITPFSEAYRGMNAILPDRHL